MWVIVPDHLWRLSLFMPSQRLGQWNINAFRDFEFGATHLTHLISFNSVIFKIYLITMQCMFPKWSCMFTSHPVSHVITSTNAFFFSSRYFCFDSMIFVKMLLFIAFVVYRCVVERYLEITELYCYWRFTMYFFFRVWIVCALICTQRDKVHFNNVWQRMKVDATSWAL